MAAITDGTSQTMHLSEWGHGLLAGTVIACWHWWADGTSLDTRFWTILLMNPFLKMPDTPEPASSAYSSSATSFHPIGPHFAFADGSVRFLKDSIDSWKLDATGYPTGASQDDQGFSHVVPGTRLGFHRLLNRTSRPGWWGGPRFFSGEWHTWSFFDGDLGRNARRG
jgi:hypothetical protein